MKAHINEIIYFTHSVFCKPQLVDIIKLFKTDAVNSKLVIVDLHKKTISTVLSNTDKITVISNVQTINLLINNCEVTSYPRVCIRRNNKCLESISGNYDNIISILKYYF